MFERSDLELLNAYLEEYIIDIKKSRYSILIDELDYFKSLSTVLTKYILEFTTDWNEFVPDTFKYRFVSKEEVIELIRCFLKQIDNKMLDLFDEYIDDKTIRFVNGEDIKQANITDDNWHQYHDCSGIIKDKRFANIVLKHNVDDIFTTLHELSHIVNLNNIDINPSWYLLTEGYANFFEMLLFNFLNKLGYNPADIKIHYNDLVGSFHNRNIDYFLDSDIIKLKLDTDYIDEQVIDTFLLVEGEKENLSEMINMIKDDTIFYKSPLDNTKYVLGLCYSSSLLRRYPCDKKIILDEYYNLESYQEKELLKKYLNYNRPYQKN